MSSEKSVPTDSLFQDIKNQVDAAISSLAGLSKELDERCTALAKREADFDSMVAKHQAEFNKGRPAELLTDEKDEADCTQQNVVVLDVGGTKFSTTKATLMTEPNSFFHGMVSSGCWQPDPTTGAYFIDREPQFFKEILTYLRNGDLNGNLDNLLDMGSLSSSDKRFLAEQIDFLQLDSLLTAPVVQQNHKSKHVQFVAFARWNFNARLQTDEEQNAAMNAAAVQCGGTRAATMTEYVECMIDGFPTPKQPQDGYLTFTGKEETFGPHATFCRSGHARLGLAMPLRPGVKLQGLTGGVYVHYCVAIK
eukprot:TRINITY_DN68167_c3_g1_i1.p1 TRINITY_DN68167_c3_g1~~TRINITY_DN68167_c3_g1_i1.p1  ORF type:complete len:307 (+),score=39.53 TRINITY_DN68167_c3_g1_i1:75-995(+)